MSRKLRILYVHANLNPPGGVNTVSVWMIEALKEEYDISVMTWNQVNFDAINRFYGTSLRASDMTIFRMPAAIRLSIERIPDDSNFQKRSGLMRWCKSLGHRYDLIMTPGNETDFGRQGIQYIHYPYQEKNWRREPRHYTGLRYLAAFMKTRIRPWRIISGFSFDRMRRNMTLTNSDWTRDKFRDVYDADGTTVYPPIPGNFPDVPWEERENGFVCIGRFSDEKRYDGIIDILAGVRSHNPDIHLHIIGTRVKCDDDYYEHLKQRAESNASWISLHENISRGQLADLICRHRYGIHGMINEHFGIAVGEMVRGGCIVFVPDSGGQVEIVGNEPHLLYRTDEEAVQKIIRVMAHPQEQAALRDYLAARKELFTTDRFVQHIQEIVRGFLDGERQTGRHGKTRSGDQI